MGPAAEEVLKAINNNPDVSDLQLFANEPLWMRTVGQMQRATQEIFAASDILQFAKSLYAKSSDANVDKMIADNGGDMDFAANLGDVRFRCNLFHHAGKQPSLIMRRLTDTIPPFSQLGLPIELLSEFERSKGIILVTGQTGSGKTTTLASGVQHINENFQRHIITIEDPIEYKIKSIRSRVTQREVGTDTKTFGRALRAALRQNPDVIMVGELRDIETVQVALSAASSGHLVLGTMHTNSAAQTVERAVSFFNGPDRAFYQNVFASVLNCVISQTLVSNKTGGRSLVYEVMKNTGSIRSLIRDDKTSQIPNVMQTGRHDGQELMNAVLARKVKAGEIDIEDALFASYNPKGLEEDLKQ